MPTSEPLLHRAAGALLALAAAWPAQAHDTWLLPLPDTPRGERMLSVATGGQFPRSENGIPVEALRGNGCVAIGTPAGTGWPLRWAADRPESLWLRTTRAVPPQALLDCRVQTRYEFIELDESKIGIYLDEARADAALRERWAQLRARGLPWRERYSKHARWVGTGEGATTTLPGPLPSGGPAQAAAPALELDLQLQMPQWPLRRGDRVRGQLLWRGQPLPSHDLELRSDASAIGIWFRTDAEGRVELPLPLAARWMVRGIVLRPAGEAEWESQFLSVVFDVQPAAPGR